MQVINIFTGDRQNLFHSLRKPIHQVTAKDCIAQVIWALPSKQAARDQSASDGNDRSQSPSGVQVVIAP